MSNMRFWKTRHKGMSKEQIEICECDMCKNTNIFLGRKPKPFIKKLENIIPQ